VNVQRNIGYTEKNCLKKQTKITSGRFFSLNKILIYSLSLIPGEKFVLDWINLGVAMDLNFRAAR
jgi:hypothetical protein